MPGQYMEPISSLEKLKDKLRSYRREDIRFNEPHFTQQMILREGNKEEVISNLLKPDNLVYFYSEPGRYGDMKYSLYFRISSNRTMKIPVVLDINKKRCIYVLTYIMRYRPWQSMIRHSR